MLGHIITIQITNLQHMVQQEKNITLIVTDTAKEYIAQQGWDQQFGARPLKRAMQKYLIDELAIKIIEGDIKEGDTATVDVEKGKIIIQASMN
jgi:ATP-dependent Clp protease ATP-binding subunit ClpA